jgi:predicted acyl esterase
MLGRLGTLVAGAGATILAGMLALCVSAAGNLVRAEELAKPSSIVEIAVRDGVKIAAAIYLPQGSGKVPALLAASPYRFDNDQVPAQAVFLWRETGPIDYYLKHGYAYVRVDVRGTGRSGGDYRYMDEAEQRDLYDIIDWITKQPWSSGKVGGIGQSYYARMQWFMGIGGHPGLACIAPYDGNIDTYRSSAYSGGIPGAFPSIWYNSNVRPINQFPAAGPSRLIDWDYPQEVRKHVTYDEFWKERAAAENIDKIKVPIFSIGVWSKVDLHLNGNIVGFQRATAPKKLLIFGSSSLFAAVGDFSSVAFHEQYLRPFYDWCLKGEQTAYLAEPPVRYFLTGADRFKAADTWPPAGIRYRQLYLGGGPSGSVTSLNDGVLTPAAPTGASTTTFHYPDPGWRLGVVGFDQEGRVDPVRRVLTFTSAPLDSDLEVTGPIELKLFASSTNVDTDFVVKLSEQVPQSAEDRGKDIQPRSRLVTKGWLRASHRDIDQRRSLEHAPWYSHDKPVPLEQGKIYQFNIAVMPSAYLFKKGSRIRLELANGDSQLTEIVFQHDYTPDKVGADTIHHDAEHPSVLSIPVMEKGE